MSAKREDPVPVDDGRRDVYGSSGTGADNNFGYGPVAPHCCGFMRRIPNALLILIPLAGVCAVGIVVSPAISEALKWQIGWNVLASFVAYLVTLKLIPIFKPYVLKGDLHGIDIGKPGRKEDKIPVPESLGVVPGVVYIITVTCLQILYGSSSGVLHSLLVEYNAALHSIGFMIFLGFADDVVDLPWRYKLILPTIATLPLLVAYSGSTVIIVPKLLRSVIGVSIELGFLYKVYMGLLAVFCTNAINIYAGINGLEVTQSILIGCAVIIHNLIELSTALQHSLTPIQPGMVDPTHIANHHLFSLCLTVPFVLTSLALLHYNVYPSQVFVGDTYTYFAGMTFAVVGICGHFSKTLLLFFIPQIANFLISVPQLFGFVPCPRHRLPIIDEKTGLLVGQSSNWNLLNVVLRLTGPMHEGTTNIVLGILQIVCCAAGFYVRYVISAWFF